jgi:Leu/Phe-tRNA-protein transferase
VEDSLEEIYHSKEFKEYAAKNLVLVKVEFPKSDLNFNEQKQYRELLKKYTRGIFPHYIAADAKETMWAGGIVGNDSPKTFVTKLMVNKEKMIKKQAQMKKNQKIKKPR